MYSTNKNSSIKNNDKNMELLICAWKENSLEDEGTTMEVVLNSTEKA